MLMGSDSAEVLVLYSLLLLKFAEDVQDILPERLDSEVCGGNREPMEILQEERWVSAEFRGQEHALSKCSFTSSLFLGAILAPEILHVKPK